MNLDGQSKKNYMIFNFVVIQSAVTN